MRYAALLVVVALVALLVFYGGDAAAWLERRSTLTRCAELENQLRESYRQGSDPAQSARLQIEVKTCYEAAKAAGAPIDIGEIAAKTCAQATAQLTAEWSHYRSTSRDDPVKRENTRNAILRIAEEQIACLRDAAAQSNTFEGLRAVRAVVAEAIAGSRARSACYRSGASGCDRIGVNEPHGDEKDTAEAQRVWLPAKDLLASIDARLAALGPAARRKRIEEQAASGVPLSMRAPTQSEKDAALARWNAAFAERGT